VKVTFLHLPAPVKTGERSMDKMDGREKGKREFVGRREIIQNERNRKTHRYTNKE
jgi:hypothetical protein